MINITTEQFADYFYQKMISESKEKESGRDRLFDYSIMASEIPFDYDEDVFINYFKERLNLKNIKINKLSSRYRFSCIVSFNTDIKSL